MVCPHSNIPIEARPKCKLCLEVEYNNSVSGDNFLARVSRCKFMCETETTILCSFEEKQPHCLPID